MNSDDGDLTFQSHALCVDSVYGFVEQAPLIHLGLSHQGPASMFALLHEPTTWFHWVFGRLRLICTGTRHLFGQWARGHGVSLLRGGVSPCFLSGVAFIGLV